MNAICSRMNPLRGMAALAGFLMTLTLWSIDLRAEDQRLLIIGDSLSDAYEMPREAGWAHLLETRLGEGWTVVNAAISGETTAGAAFRGDRMLQDHQPSHVLIILGGNDGLRALSPGQVRDNLELLVQKAQGVGAEVALMQIRLPASLGPVYLRRFEAIYPSLAQQYDLVLMPFFLESIFDQPGMIMDDGIHPTTAAQPLMMEFIWPHLTAFLAWHE